MPWCTMFWLSQRILSTWYIHSKSSMPLNTYRFFVRVCFHIYHSMMQLITRHGLLGKKEYSCAQQLWRTSRQGNSQGLISITWCVGVKSLLAIHLAFIRQLGYWGMFSYTHTWRDMRTFELAHSSIYIFIYTSLIRLKNSILIGQRTFHRL